MAAILAAASLMLAVTGYSFLAGNHEVYLLEPLRRAGLATFEGDYFVTGTLQYHGLFATISAWLFRLDAARPAFLVLFLILLLTTAWAWWRLVRSLGGGVTAYLVAVVAYHVLLGDRALGFYSLLQDGQFNAGNVAAVSLLVGIVMWVEGRLAWAGLAFGVAGAFHLNYAVVAPGLWVALVGWAWLSRERSERRDHGSDLPKSEPGPRRSLRSRLNGRVLVGSALALVPSTLNVALALPSKLDLRESMPLDRFVDLYVRLRHPHHYDPGAWPWWVWAAFLLPVPLAVLAWRRRRDDPRWTAAATVWLLLMALQLFAGLTAGLFWLGETFVQLSLWRFSPHAKLLAVSAAVVWLVGPTPESAAPSHGSGDQIDSRRQWIRVGHPVMRRVAQTLCFAGMAGLLVIAWLVPRPRDRGIDWVIAVWESGLPMLTWMSLGVGACGLVLAMWSERPAPWISARRAAVLNAVSRTFSVGLPAGLVGVQLMIGWMLSGVGLPPPQQPPPNLDVVLAAHWAKRDTPPDVLFLLPPDASAFSVNARRGQVVSFKLVPQLSGELIEWDRRLRDVLGVDDLTRYSAGLTGYRDVQRRMRERYDELPTSHLFAVAEKYGARYVFRSDEDPAADAPIAWRGERGGVLYDLNPR